MQKGMARGMARADLADFADFVAFGSVVDSLSERRGVVSSRLIGRSVLLLSPDHPTSLAVCPRVTIRGPPLSVLVRLVSGVYSLNMLSTPRSTLCAVHNMVLPKKSKFHGNVPH